MDTIHRPADNSGDPPPPDVTPLFTELLEAEAARRGLPPEPWAA